MKAFRKNISAAREQAVGRISGGLRKAFGHAQRKWAHWMHRKLNGRPKRTLIVALSLFVAFSTLYNGWILIGSPSQKEIRFGNIHVPQKTGQPKIIHDAYSTELQRIRTFRKYMDSLYRSESGRPTYDSIMKARPGLLDSVKALENLVGR